MNLIELTDYLDNYLDVRAIPDHPNAYNGLQVFSPKDINIIATAVDATLYSINEAVRLNADLLLVHHGLFWNIDRLVGPYYERIASCIKNDLGVYSSHLPLDVHPVVGNNYVLMRKLGFEPEGAFMPYVDNLEVGVYSRADTTLTEIVSRLEDVLGPPDKIFPFGDQHIRKIGVISGGAGGIKFIRSAYEQGIDLLVTGEGEHPAVFVMEELGINCIYNGHYLTETVGVQALGDHLEEQFGLETVFIDHPSGL